MNAESLAEAAKQYAAQGIEVLPCWWRDFGHDKAKAPIAKLVPNGFLDATTHIGTIEYWWRVQPKALIGGVVPDGVIVLDFDPRNVITTPGEDEAPVLALSPELVVRNSREVGQELQHRSVRHPHLPKRPRRRGHTPLLEATTRGDQQKAHPCRHRHQRRRQARPTQRH